MTKRKHRSTTAAEAPDGVEPKRLRPSAEGVSSQSITYGRVDPTYGQRSAIPGLDDLDDWDWEVQNEEGVEGEDGMDGEVEDRGYSRNGTKDGEDPDLNGGRVDLEALRYLRSVREEASGIPTLLVAPRQYDGDGDGNGADRGIYDDGVGDSRGWYEDGAYTAAPGPEDGEDLQSDADNGGGRDAQKVYCEALLKRLGVLRKQLSQVPPRGAVEKLGADHGCHMADSLKDCELWRWRIANTDPKPAQLAGMDKETVLRILKMVGDRKRGFLGMHTLFGEGIEKSRTRISAWLWGLLAKLPDRGEMASGEVAVVRDLGKRAVWVNVELQGVVDMGKLEEHVEDEVEDEDEYGQAVDGDNNNGQTEELCFEEEDTGFINEEEENPQDQRQSSSSPAKKFPSSTLNDNTISFIGPMSPESLRGDRLRRQSQTRHSKDAKPMTIGDAKEREEEKGQLNEENDEEEALARARASLLARLDLQNNNDPQPHSNISKRHTIISKGGESIAEEEIHSSHSNSTPKPGVGEGQQNEVQRPHSEPTNKHNGGNENDAQLKLQDPTQSANPTDAVKTLLDMIITVAGEVYGQRDLLEFREKWA